MVQAPTPSSQLNQMPTTTMPHKHHSPIDKEHSSFSQTQIHARTYAHHHALNTTYSGLPSDHCKQLQPQYQVLPSTEASFPRRKSSMLEINSLLCDFASASMNSPSPDSQQEDESDIMDSEPINSSFMFHQNHLSSAATPASSPPLSPENNDIQHDRCTQCLHEAKYQAAHQYCVDSDAYGRQHREPSSPLQPSSRSSPLIPQQQKVTLPSIKSFTMVDDLRSDIHHELSHGSATPRDSCKPWSQMQRLEQLATITETYGQAQLQDPNNIRRLPSLLAPPPTSMSGNVSPVQQSITKLGPHMTDTAAHQQQSLRRSSYDISQSRYSPISPGPNSHYSSRRMPQQDQRRHSDSPSHSSAIEHAHDRYSNGIHHFHGPLRGLTPTYQGYPQHQQHPHQQHQQHQQQQQQQQQQQHSYPFHPHMYQHPQHHAHSHMTHTAFHHDPNSVVPIVPMVKAKRKRANANQLKVLNQVFQHTFFPSTEQRIQLGKQLGMSPRTVQIWFQNKRQSWRSKTRGPPTASSIEDDNDENNNNGQAQKRRADVEAVNGNKLRRLSNATSTGDDVADDGEDGCDSDGRLSVPDSPAAEGCDRDREDGNESVMSSDEGSVSSQSGSVNESVHSHDQRTQRYRQYQQQEQKQKPKQQPKHQQHQQQLYSNSSQTSPRLSPYSSSSPSSNAQDNRLPSITAFGNRHAFPPPTSGLGYSTRC